MLGNLRVLFLLIFLNLNLFSWEIGASYVFPDSCNLGENFYEVWTISTVGYRYSTINYSNSSDTSVCGNNLPDDGYNFYWEINRAYYNSYYNEVSCTYDKVFLGSPVETCCDSFKMENSECVSACLYNETYDSTTGICEKCGIVKIDDFTTEYDDSCEDNPTGKKFGKLQIKDDMYLFEDYETGMTYGAIQDNKEWTTEKWADGSIYTKTTYKDGREETILKNPDGTQISDLKLQDGSTLITQVNPDGSVAKVSTDITGKKHFTELTIDEFTRSSVAYDDDTNMLEIKDYSGSGGGNNQTTKIDLNKGNEVIDFSDGTKVVTSTNPDSGAITVTQTNPDGTEIKAIIQESGTVQTSVQGGYFNNTSDDDYSQTVYANDEGFVTSVVTDFSDSSVNDETYLINPDGSKKVVTKNKDGSMSVTDYNTSNEVTDTKELFDVEFCLDGAPPLNYLCDRSCEAVGYTTITDSQGSVLCDKVFDMCDEPRQSCASSCGVGNFISYNCDTQDCNCKSDMNDCANDCGGIDKILNFNEGSNYFDYICECKPPLAPKPDNTLNNPEDDPQDINGDTELNCDDLMQQCINHCGVGNIDVNTCKYDYTSSSPQSACKCTLNPTNLDDYDAFVLQASEWCRDHGTSLFTVDFDYKTFKCKDTDLPEVPNEIAFDTDAPEPDTPPIENIACFTVDGKKGFLLDGVCVPLSDGAGASGNNVEDYVVENTTALKANTDALNDGLTGISSAVSNLTDILSVDTSTVENLDFPSLTDVDTDIENSNDDLIDYFLVELSDFRENFLDNMGSYKTYFDNTASTFSNTKNYNLNKTVTTNCFSFTLWGKFYSFDLCSYSSLIAPYFSLFITLLFSFYAFTFAMSNFVKGD